MKRWVLFLGFVLVLVASANAQLGVPSSGCSYGCYSSTTFGTCSYRINGEVCYMTTPVVQGPCCTDKDEDGGRKSGTSSFSCCDKTQLKCLSFCYRNDCDDNNKYVYFGNTNNYCDCDITGDGYGGYINPDGRNFIASEICGDGKDNDCDGQVDENCICTPNSEQLCENQKGVCSGTMKKCVGGISWEDCAAKYATNTNYETIETKCGDTLDNDCDNLADCADSDCASSGLCGCKSDADCGSEEKCNVATGVCYASPFQSLTDCSDSRINSFSDCNSVGPFHCYWDSQLLGGDCKPIEPGVTTCDMLDYEEVCKETNIIDCSWVNGECIGEEVPPDEFNFNCEPGTFPQADGNCGTSADPSGVCNLNNVCEYGELCGACADCVGYGMGGCATDAWCDSTIGCIIPPELSGDCGSTELNDYLGIETFFVNDCEEKCLNTWTIFSEDQLYADVDLDNDGDNECCLGTCSDGQLTSVEGMITFHERGLCMPIEGSPSEGTMKVIIKTKNPDGSYSTSPAEYQSCTILPSRRVPFSSIFGVLAGLIIIVLFYVLRKKY